MSVPTMITYRRSELRTQDYKKRKRKLTSMSKMVGFVKSSQAMDARFFSPPERPLFIMSPITIIKD